MAFGISNLTSEMQGVIMDWEKTRENQSCTWKWQSYLANSQWQYLDPCKHWQQTTNFYSSANTSHGTFCCSTCLIDCLCLELFLILFMLRMHVHLNNSSLELEWRPSKLVEWLLQPGVHWKSLFRAYWYPISCYGSFMLCLVTLWQLYYIILPFYLCVPWQ